ncbi:TolC family protein [Fulvivirgaceae bacterium BMA10]|uniref:TolC family protein n=1 Tax=Splendidivirga corallicola TaxID=3051826 RepID=A0ABT8KH69_9BACT|nr:TolC family protein [Fulvivirgaceae bacterium BMA10]
MINKIRINFFIILLFASLGAFAQDTGGKKVWTLQECIEHSLKDNLSIQQSKLTVEENKAFLKQARGNMLPNLNAGGNYGYNWGRGIDPTENTFVNERITFSGFSASSNMTLFGGFQVRNGIKQSNLDLEASELDLKTSENRTILNVATFYLNVIFNQELLNNAKTQLESTNTQLSRTEKLVEAGSLPLSNLLDLKSQQASNEANVISSENALTLSLLNLKQLLQIPASDPFEIEIPNLDAPSALLLSKSANQIYDYAEANQPEIQSANLKIESADYGAKIAKGGLYPSLSLSGSISTNYSDAAVEFVPDGTFSVEPEQRLQGNLTGNPSATIDLFSVSPNGNIQDVSASDQFDRNLSQRLTFNLQIPIFNRLQTSTAIQRANIAKQRAEVNAIQEKQTLRQTIEQAYNDALASAKSYEASLKQVEALEESFRMAQQQYDNGVINFVDFQIAQNNMFQAKSDLVRNKFDFIFKTKVLDFYQGNPINF